MAAFTPTLYDPSFITQANLQHYPSIVFPEMRPVHWLHSHFAVGGWSPLQRLSGMLTAHMTAIAPHNGFTWHPHRGLEIYTWVLEGTLHHEDTTGGAGSIVAGELQRMFSGNWIEHQELNQSDDPARVIQIWFAADARYRHLEPHYQQLGRDALPQYQIGNARVTELIGGDSPMDSHVDARLMATTLAAGGSLRLQAPLQGEDLFLYVTDGAGSALHQDTSYSLGQYDVILARPNADAVLCAGEQPLHFLSFYLPRFM